jgi:hypothetical protein
VLAVMIVMVSVEAAAAVAAVIWDVFATNLQPHVRISPNLL